MALPELIAAPCRSETDVAVQLGPLELGEVDLSASRTDLRLSTDGSTFQIEGVATYQVRDGRQIIIDPLPGADDALVRLNLLHLAFGMLLHQRGLLALHGSVVAVGRGAVVFLGFSGDGKSTTAAALVRRGHALVADDVAAIQVDTTDAPRVWPAYPQLRLLPDSLASLGGTIGKHASSTEKRADYRVDQFTTGPLALGRIYVLAYGEENEIQPLRTAAACGEFLRHSFVAGILKITGTAPTHFHGCARLAQDVPVARLVRRRSLAELDQLAEMIEDDIHVCA
jgi:hypothetical protein